MTRKGSTTLKCINLRKGIRIFGTKAHIGVYLELGLVYTVVGMATNVADVTRVDQ